MKADDSLAKLSVLKLTLKMWLILFGTIFFMALLCGIYQKIAHTAVSNGKIVLWGGGVGYLLLFFWQRRLLRHQGLDWRVDFFAAPHPRAATIRQSLWLGSVFVLSMWGVAILNTLLLAKMAGVHNANGLFGERNVSNVLQQLLVLVLLAPICEELFFRGILLRRLCLTKSLRSSLLVSSAIFALAHLDLFLLPRFFLGLATGLVYSKTGSLWLPTLLHMSWNGWVVLQSLLGPLVQKWIGLLLFLICLALMIGSHRMLRAWPTQTDCMPPLAVEQEATEATEDGESNHKEK